jgi:hypothetical protein
VLLSEQRDTAAARRFFTRALKDGPVPVEVTTDKAGPYLRVIDDLIPAAAHITEQYDNNPIESDHARLKARLRPMRGLKQVRSAARIAAGHASHRTSAAATMTSPPTPHRRSAWPPHSPNSHRPCDGRFLHNQCLPRQARRNRPRTHVSGARGRDGRRPHSQVPASWHVRLVARRGDA